MNPSKEHLEYLNQMKKRKQAIFFMQVFLVVFFLLLWEVSAKNKWIDPFIFSSPSRMWKAFIELVQNGMLFKHVGVTLGETAVGFLVSTILGTVIAILLWWNSFLSHVMQPYLVVLNSLPKTALAPIIIVWIGNNVKSVVATAIMTAIIVTIMSVLEGFLSIDKEKIKLIETFGGGKVQILQKVVLPASVPTIMNVLKINIGLSFVGVMVGEFLVAQAGLGYLIVYGSQVFIRYHIRTPYTRCLFNICLF